MNTPPMSAHSDGTPCGPCETCDGSAREGYKPCPDCFGTGCGCEEGNMNARYCAECGAKLNPFGRCPMDPCHGVEAGGFHCPDCGTELNGTSREGSKCLACRSD